MPIENKITPIKVTPVIAGNALLNSDKTHSLAPDKARYLAQQLVMAADCAESCFTEIDLLVPFDHKRLIHLYHQKFFDDQQYSIKFTDLGEFVSHVVSLAPNNARYLAQQLLMAAERAEKLLDDTNLLVPFNQNGITQLHHQRYLYEQQYSIKFTDLGEFVSHVVHKQLHKLS